MACVEAELEIDVVDPDWTYLELYAPGRSRVHLAIEVPADVRLDQYRVTVRFQKSACQYLPNTGRAKLVLAVDGVPLANHENRPSTASEFSVTLPPPRLDAARRELDISLGEDSSTGIRLYAVEIRSVRSSK